MHYRSLVVSLSNDDERTIAEASPEAVHEPSDDPCRCANEPAGRTGEVIAREALGEHTLVSVALANQNLATEAWQTRGKPGFGFRLMYGRAAVRERRWCLRYPVLGLSRI